MNKAIGTAILCLWSCTNESVYPEPFRVNSYQDKKHVHISAKICPEKKALKNQKTHLYLVLDTSSSMESNGFRKDVLGFIKQYNALYNGMTLIGFSDQANVLDPDEEITFDGLYSNYEKAVLFVSEKIERKASKIKDTQKTLEQFHVVWISDGRFSEKENIQRTFSNLKNASKRLGVSLKIHAVLIKSRHGVESFSYENMRNIASAGGGFFVRLAESGYLDPLDLGLNQSKDIPAGLTYVLAQNKSAFPLKEKVVADSDEDGVHDALEHLLGADPYQKDTDLDGVGDLIEYHITGTDLLVDDVVCGVSSEQDTDRDGLSFCEENILGTNDLTYDTDEDGFSDFMETVFETDPLRNDVFEDKDLDHIYNGEELLHGTNPSVQDAYARGSTGFLYLMERTNDEGKNCYKVDVSYISVASLLDGKKNTWMLSWLENGDEVPNVLCVKTRYFSGEKFTIPETRPGDVWKKSKKYVYQSVQTCREHEPLCDPEKTMGVCMYDIDECRSQRPCFSDGECGFLKKCDAEHGLCMMESNEEPVCAEDSDCGKHDRCYNGLCMEKIFSSMSCEKNSDCLMGTCDLSSGWCVPYLKRHFCASDEDCVGGRCSKDTGVCVVSSALSLHNFNAQSDCWNW